MTDKFTHSGSKYLRKIHCVLDRKEIKAALNDAGFANFSDAQIRAIFRVVEEATGYVDVYAVLEAFSAHCPARQHAIKKLLCAGLRDKADVMQDLNEAFDAVDRAIDMEEAR